MAFAMRTPENTGEPEKKGEIFRRSVGIGEIVFDGAKIAFADGKKHAVGMARQDGEGVRFADEAGNAYFARIVPAKAGHLLEITRLEKKRAGAEKPATVLSRKICAPDIIAEGRKIEWGWGQTRTVDYVYPAGKPPADAYFTTSALSSIYIAAMDANGNICVRIMDWDGGEGDAQKKSGSSFVKDAALPQLTGKTFAPFVSSGTAVVEFWAPWCGWCLKMREHTTALASEMRGKVKFAEVDISRQKLLQEKYLNGSSSIPVVLVFQDGEQVGRQVGYVDKRHLEKLIGEAAGK
jgi:thioredoxin 1